MRDEEELFDDCAGWSEADLIRHIASARLDRRDASPSVPVSGSSAMSPSLIFELAIHGKVADLQRAMAYRGGGAAAAALPLNMPELFSTIGLLEESWKARRISFSQAIRGLFTIREVVKHLESGRAAEASAMHFFGSGLIGTPDREEHVFGAQIVAERLFVSGWRTQANVSGGLKWLMGRVQAEHFDFVGISVGCDESLAGLADRIAQIRECSYNRRIDVIVGGAVFAYSDGRYDFLGADYVARTADDAIRFLSARVKVTGSSFSH